MFLSQQELAWNVLKFFFYFIYSLHDKNDKQKVYQKQFNYRYDLRASDR